MVRGPPGAGKTLFSLQFLLTGAENGEESLFITLEETEADLRTNAASVGFDLSGVSILDLSPGSEFFTGDQTYDIFTPEETAQGPLVTEITDSIRDADPDRVVLDPVSQLRYLAPDQYQFRRQILSFIRFLREQEATVFFTSQATQTSSDEDLQFLSDGVVTLRATDGERVLSVPKFRGSDAQSGEHSFRITADGIDVYPELVPGQYDREFAAETISAGIPEIDELLGGGITRGTVTILSGPTGVGKTTLGTQFMKEAAGRGERSMMYLFEENRGTFLHRTSAINVPVREMLDRGTLAVDEVEPLQRSAAEFAHDVRREVETHDSRIVMIDGVDGYRMSLHGKYADLTSKLHSLCRYLKNMGVTVILVDEAGSVSGGFEPTSENISYLADGIVFLRYLELDGRLHKAIGVLKKRTGDFERALREFEITEHGLKVGEPLEELHGILQGSPERVDGSRSPSGAPDDR